MLAFERREKILNILYKEKKVHVGNLATEFNVTEETIRRDLEKLEKDGIVTRTYGGAVLNLHTNEDLPYQTRNTANIDEKRYIASKIDSLVLDGNTLMADASSTVFEALKELSSTKEGLTVLTNSVTALSEFTQTKMNIISTGGLLRKRSGSLVGSIAENTVQNYNVDAAIISCKGISLTHGITESNENESELKKQMIQQASKVILLVDHTKFNKIAFIKFIDMSKVDFLVTDKKPSEEWLAYLEQNNIEVIF
ncbi:DeoR/GlpR family DNA-binding transcription regulator [Heyndrickxia ginsengihumi]|uniref:DeoR faimly transcriptional regulator n=1 Tax=Heyndrickxia ginsengihumi TaxID=363870 RepID=A0A0A6VGY6_9BACI|nr:DeoR/GlpR family DNA-binding transcription regulator [Heyndrickxia ginsengihumi]KHD85889.1 DeoR faimly transcriptional regulator [Heyndrickxia ginsengihumi]MBE6184705.1 DeoR/GlpR transcriptional regulator [Bacillus sp. (in: firmicutes)]MCM3023609.1 DeoR/GlpR family DNA-binding transcription regulator [Heyndrickxia ginsengihumi]NEY18874.1 DeoR/GlpR transcriptional regulator [Heyndrickxia ginsengihumi]